MNKIEEDSSLIRFLLFRGKWENEGIFTVVETDKDIVIFSVGRDFYTNGFSHSQQIGKTYLEEKKQKIRGIIVLNTNFRNIGLLDDVCKEIGFHVPIYASYYSKVILDAKFFKLKNKIWIVKEENEYRLGELVLFFLSCDSYTIGNLGVHCIYGENSLFFLEDFYFSSLLDIDLFHKNNFFPSLEQFLAKKKQNNYLITSCQNIHWYNDNSLFFIKNHLPTPISETPFFIFYDFDWLHVFELLEMAHLWNKKIIIVNFDFFVLLRKILDSVLYLKKIICPNTSNVRKNGDNFIYLLVINPQQTTLNLLDYHLEEFSERDKQDFSFVVGLPPMLGGEEKLARFLDYLYKCSNRVLNLSKSKKIQLRLGISFSDLQFLIKMLNPKKIIFLNNSYRNRDILNYLPKKVLSLENEHCCDIVSAQTISFLTNKKNSANLDNTLFKQKQRLKHSGLLVVCLSSFLEETKITLVSLHLEKIAVPISIEQNSKKLEEKIRKWWSNKITNDLDLSSPLKSLKIVIEKRLSGLLRKTISYQLEKESDEPTELAILFFLREKKGLNIINTVEEEE